MCASWGFVGCVVSGDGDFGEIGYVCGFSMLDAEGIGLIILGVGGDAGDEFCSMGFGCVGLAARSEIR